MCGQYISFQNVQIVCFSLHLSNLRGQINENNDCTQQLYFNKDQIEIDISLN